MGNNNNVNQEPEVLSEEQIKEQLSEQTRIRREKLAALQEAGNDPYKITKYDVTHHSDEIKANIDNMTEEDTVVIAGRMMSRRIMGKASFCNPLRYSSSNV